MVSPPAAASTKALSSLGWDIERLGEFYLSHEFGRDISDFTLTQLEDASSGKRCFNSTQLATTALPHT